MGLTGNGVRLDALIVLETSLKQSKDYMLPLTTACVYLRIEVYAQQLNRSRAMYHQMYLFASSELDAVDDGDCCFPSIQ